MSLRKKMLCAACALVTVFGVSVSAMAEDVTESSTQVQESEIGEGTLNLLSVNRKQYAGTGKRDRRRDPESASGRF